MLRLTIVLLVAIAVNETAEGAGKAVPRHNPYRGWHRTAIILPAGLPRRHYDFRTTISYGEPSTYRQPYASRVVPVYEEPLYAPAYITPWYGAALLPDLPALPGYDGSGYSYIPYWDRLPYACGVYGYC